MRIEAHTQCSVTTRHSGPWSPTGHGTLTFGFDGDNPAAVSLIINEVRWVFDRTLLEGAVADMSIPCNVLQGEGDVKVHRPGMSRVVVELHTPDSQARIEVAASAVVDFVRQVQEAVPEPTYDVDRWVEEFLRGETA